MKKQSNLSLKISLQSKKKEEFDTTHYNSHPISICLNFFLKIAITSTAISNRLPALKMEIDRFLRRLQENTRFELTHNKINKFIHHKQNVMHGFYFNRTISDDSIQFNVS